LRFLIISGTFTKSITQQLFRRSTKSVEIALWGKLIKKKKHGFLRGRVWIPTSIRLAKHVRNFNGRKYHFKNKENDKHQLLPTYATLEN